MRPAVRPDLGTERPDSRWRLGEPGGVSPLTLT
jgi:hypothetical protein